MKPAQWTRMDEYRHILSTAQQQWEIEVNVFVLQWLYNEICLLAMWSRSHSVVPSQWQGHLQDFNPQNYLHTKTPLCAHWNLKTVTLNVRGPSYLCLTRSISWQLMPWLLTSPGHQQPWYWLYRICRSFSYLRKCLKYLCQVNVEEWHKTQINVYVPSEKFTGKGLRCHPQSVFGLHCCGRIAQYDTLYRQAISRLHTGQDSC